MATIRIKLRNIDGAAASGAVIPIRTIAPLETKAGAILQPGDVLEVTTDAQGDGQADLTPTSELGRGGLYAADIPSARPGHPPFTVKFIVPDEDANLEDVIVFPAALRPAEGVPAVPLRLEGLDEEARERMEADAALSARIDAVSEGGEGAHDEAARMAAAVAKLEAETNTAQLQRLGNQLEDVSTLAGENRDKLVTPTQAQATAAAGDTVYGWTVTRLRQLIAAVVKAATTTIRGTVLIARNVDVDSSETDLSRVPDVSKTIRLIRRILGEDVRSIPEAEASHVGRPLVATSSRRPWGAWARLGTDGYDDNSITEAKLSAEVRAKLAASGDEAGPIPDNSITPAKAQADTAPRRKGWRDRIEAAHVALQSNTLPAVEGFSVGRDFVVMGRASENTVVAFRDISDPATALTECRAGDVMWLQNSGWVRVGNIVEGSPALRALITAVQGKADENDARLDALDLFGPATVIEAGPPLIHNDETRRNLNVSIRHPLGAYSDATLMSVAPAGQSPVYVAYDHTQPSQTVDVDLSTEVLSNIWDQEIPAAGDVPAMQLYTPGSYVPVEIRLRDGRNGPTIFIRVIDVLVLEAPARVPVRFETAIGASPAVLPVGTHTIAGEFKRGDNYFPFSIRLAAITAASRRFWMVEANTNRPAVGTSAGFDLSYTPATRTLVHSDIGQDVTFTLFAIGEN